MRDLGQASGTTDKARWDRIREVYHTLIDCPDAERRRLLDEACAGDLSLLREVESLLAYDARASNFLAAPARCEAEEALSTASEPCLIGHRIGAYLLRGVLGRGGMGVVYGAEQENPRRTVALKLLRSAPFLDEHALRLFRREAQALARLNHPGIAAIYEAGQSSEGWCYFAMELVDGIPLHHFVKDRQPSVRERLQVFLRICAAVHYAHQRGVIHRDLKPSNILVNTDSQAKILDFGLARISDPEGDPSQITRPGTFQGTLAYASPEQARGQTDEVDARSDVYSLGVILYELLADRPPYELVGLPLPEAVNIICNSPPRPLGAARRDLRGDLETLTRKALEKTPALRYSSAAALGEDLERYLARQPILAQPPSAAYQLRKLVSRHRVTVAVAASFLFLLVASAVTTAWLAVRATKERDLAQAARTEASDARDAAEQFAAFLEGLFERASPMAAPTKDPSLRQVLDEGHARLEKVENPLVRARLMTVLGKVYTDLNDFPRARELLDTALGILRARLEPRHPGLADALQATARLRTWMAEPGADEAARELIEIRSRQFTPEHRTVAQAWNILGEGYFYSRDYANAAVAFRAAHDIYKLPGKERTRDCSDVLVNLGYTLSHLNQPEESERLLREAVDLCKELDDLPSTLNAMEAVAQIVWKRDTRESESIYAEELGLARKGFQPKHAKLSWILRNYAYTVRHNRGPAAAEPLQREALEIARVAYGGAHWEIGQCLVHLAGTLGQLERKEEATSLIREAADMYQKLFGPGDQRTQQVIALLEQSAAGAK